VLSYMKNPNSFLLALIVYSAFRENTELLCILICLTLFHDATRINTKHPLGVNRYFNGGNICLLGFAFLSSTDNFSLAQFLYMLIPVLLHSIFIRFATIRFSGHNN